MVVHMDEQFLVHSAVHRAVLRLLRNCVGDDIQEQLDGRNRVLGAAKNAVRSEPSDYELDREYFIAPSELHGLMDGRSVKLAIYFVQPHTDLPRAVDDLLP